MHYLANCSNEGGPSFTIATGNGCLDTGLNRKYGMNASAVASRGHTGSWTCRWLQCLNWFKLTQHGVVLVRSYRNSLECAMFNTNVKTGWFKTLSHWDCFDFSFIFRVINTAGRPTCSIDLFSTVDLLYIIPLEARDTVYLQDNMVRWLWNQVNQYFTLLGVFRIGLQIVKSFPIVPNSLTILDYVLSEVVWTQHQWNASNQSLLIPIL